MTAHREETAASETKRCGRCGIRKPTGEFHRRGTGYQAWCKPCRRAYAAAHYQANKPKRRSQNTRRQVEFRAWYTNLKKGKPCEDCGEEFHHAAMQWDHLPGSDKRGALAYLVRYGSRRLVLEEIEKCELVCANCHAIRSYRRRDGVVFALRDQPDKWLA